MPMCEQGERRDLLEWLAQETACPYLSDLKQQSYWPALLRALHKAPRDAWPLREWQDACQYLVGACACAESEEQARACLEEKLERPQA